MSPTNRHLKWAEIKDFAPGLWTEGSSFAMPPTAAQQMDNCIAMPGGGLRAFFKPAALTKTGLTLTSEKVTGIFAVALPDDGNDDELVLDLWLVTANESTKVSKVYRIDRPSGSTDWATEKTFAAGTLDNYGPASMMSYFVGSDLHVLLSGGFSGGSETGLWAFDLSDNGEAEVQAGTSGNIPIYRSILHQSRIIAFDGFAPSRVSIIWYSDPGALTFPDANFIDIEPGALTQANVLMHSYAPSDLMIGKQNGVFAIVQGEITDPVVRNMGGSHLLGRGNFPATTPNGIAVLVPEDSVYLTSSGESFEDIAPQLDLSALTSQLDGEGDLVWNANYLLIPKGYVFDWRSKSWSRVTAMADVHHQFLQRSPSDVSVQSGNLVSTVYASDVGNNPDLWTLDMTDGATRNNTYTWKSAPFRSEDGRQIEIREVQLYVETQDADADISVIVNGTTRTISNLTLGRHQLSFLFRERAEMLDVTITPSAGTSTNEAPIIEVVRIGQGQGHLLH